MGFKEDYEDNRLEFLKVLIEKHKEVSSLYYIRFNVFLALFTVVMGAIAATLVSGVDKLQPRALWFIISIEGFVGVLICGFWLRIMQISNTWIDFWKAKIVYFEAHEGPSKQWYHFFVDKHLDNPETMKKQQNPTLNEKEIEKINDILGWRVMKSDEDHTKGIATTLNLFIKSILAVFAVVFLLSAIFFAIDFDPHKNMGRSSKDPTLKSTNSTTRGTAQQGR